MQKYLQAVDMELPKNLSVIRQTEFNKVLFDFIADATTNEIYIFDEQVGVALEYKPPTAMINDLHDRHSERIESYAIEATVYTLRGVKRLKRKTWLYSLHAICEMCRWAKQPMVDDFLNFVWEEVEDIKRKRDKLFTQQEEIIDRTAGRMADIMFPQFVKTLSVTFSEQLIEQLTNTLNINQSETATELGQILTIIDDLPLSALPNTLTVLHIKNYLGIGKVQAYQLMRSEGFPAFKIGSSVLVEKRKFIEWLDKKAIEPREYV